MSDIIHLLPDHVANQIAAGEVVQRPASVVKELLENAIDAGADNIKLLIKDAGKTLVQVIDNGIGMSATDARMSFERHATSKISKAEDLFQLQTKGFRGEALASIAAIAYVELKTKQKEDSVGTKIVIKGSKVVLQEPVSTPEGTSIAVKNLFYNIPARRNFLKSDKVEMRHIIDEFQRVALAHPDVAFMMYHNENEVYHLPVSNLKKRIVTIFGKKTNEKLVPINEETALLNIQGFVAKPEFAKKKRGEQFFFVNHRFIKSAYLNHAVKTAFEGLISQAHHPGYFLFLKVPADSIDINIHPTKTEIKFNNEQEIYAIIRATVKHSLGQYNVAPVLDFNRDPSMDTPYSYKDKSPSKTPEIKVDRNFNPFQNKQEPQWEALYSEPDESPIVTQPSENISPDYETGLFHTASEQTHTITQQLHNKYIVSSIKSGMVFIHQNRAHQRILYEAFLRKMTMGEPVSQQLLFPVKLHFDKPDLSLLKELKDDLESSGFQFGVFQDETVTILGVPSQLNEQMIHTIMEELIAFQKEDIPDANFSHVDFIAKTLAKNQAVKVGQSLTDKEQEAIVNNLFTCKEPQVSPFGLACYTTITINEIDQRL